MLPLLLLPLPLLAPLLPPLGAPAPPARAIASFAPPGPPAAPAARGAGEAELLEWVGGELLRLVEEGRVEGGRAEVLEALLLAERPHLALERLGQALAEDVRRRFEQESSRHTASRAAFDALLREVGVGMVASEAETATRSAELPALVRARIELLLAEAREYTHTAERFSHADEAVRTEALRGCGVYLAMAVASLERARWLAGAPSRPAEAPAGRTPAGGASLPPAVLAAALDATERRLLQAVAAEPALATELRGPNAQVGLARDLLAAGRTDAALLHHLEALHALGLRLGAASAPPAAELAARATALRTRLEELSGDTTLGALFLELGEDELAHGATGGAGVLLGDVVPELLRLRSATAEERAEPSGALLTVTLVRWPYS